MRGAGRGVGGWGQGRLRTTQGQTGQKCKAAAQVGAVQPRPVPRGAVRRLAGPPAAGQAGAGAPRKAGLSGQGLEAPPPHGEKESQAPGGSSRATKPQLGSRSPRG